MPSLSKLVEYGNPLGHFTSSHWQLSVDESRAVGEAFAAAEGRSDQDRSSRARQVKDVRVVGQRGGEASTWQAAGDQGFARLSARERLAGTSLLRSTNHGCYHPLDKGFIAHPVLDLSTATCVIILLFVESNRLPPTKKKKQRANWDVAIAAKVLDTSLS